MTPSSDIQTQVFNPSRSFFIGIFPRKIPEVQIHLRSLNVFKAIKLLREVYPQIYFLSQRCISKNKRRRAGLSARGKEHTETAWLSPRLGWQGGTPWLWEYSTQRSWSVTPPSRNQAGGLSLPAGGRTEAMRTGRPPVGGVKA